MALSCDASPDVDPMVEPRSLLWRARAWLRAATFIPIWLPKRLRHPVVGYAGAVVLVGLSVAASFLLSVSLPGYAFPAALSFLAILVVAISWGAGPVLLASALASLLLNFTVISPRLHWSFQHAADLVGFLVSLASGAAIGLVASQAEARRRHAASERAELAAILDLLPDALTVWDRSGRVVRINQQIRRGQALALGTSLAQLTASVTFYRADGTPIPAEDFPVARALRGEPATAAEVRLSSGDGQDRYLLLQAVALRDSQGKVAGAITLSHDLTALKLAEAERRRLLAAEQQARVEAEAAMRQHRVLQAITDAALAHLASKDLLGALLVRITEALSVDNTAILIPTDEGRQLLVYMAHGPEEEITGQVRIAIGQGIAGRIAATRQPLVVEDLRTVEVANPFLKQTIRSLMGLPLVVEDRLVGVLHVGTVAARRFTQEDLLLLRLAGDRIALALDHVRLYEEEQRLRLEAADRAAELEATFEAIADGVFVFDRAGGVLRGNRAGRELLQMTESPAFYGRSLAERGQRTQVRDDHDLPIPPPEWPLFRVFDGEVLTGEHAVDLKVRTSAGHERDLSVSGAPIRDQQGRITGAVCVVRDVTERRRLDAQVAADRNRLQQVLDVLPEGILIAEAHPPAVAAMNRAAEALLGVKMVGQPVPIPPLGTHDEFAARRIDGTPYPVEDLPLERALLRGEVVHGDQYLMRNAATGREIAMLANSAPLRDHENSISGAVLAFQDISAIKDLERQREEFLATVSHDLKNPLTSILGLSQMLRLRAGRLAEAEQARFVDGLDSIARTARLMATQINELLDLTRTQMGRPLQLELAPTDVGALLAGVVDEYQRTTDRHTLRLDREQDAVVGMVDAPRLRRALINLLTNAIKYSPQGGEIGTMMRRVERSDGTWLTISVADQGVGIPAGEVDRAAEGFYRASNVVGRFTGSGLGLAGVRQVIAQHGGTLAMESTQGLGTTVTMHFPLLRPPGGEATVE